MKKQVWWHITAIPALGRLRQHPVSKNQTECDECTHTDLLHLIEWKMKMLKYFISSSSESLSPQKPGSGDRFAGDEAESPPHTKLSICEGRVLSLGLQATASCDLATSLALLPQFL
jgi:hypothetical protein